MLEQKTFILYEPNFKNLNLFINFSHDFFILFSNFQNNNLHTNNQFLLIFK